MLEEQAKELGGNSNPLLLCFVLDIFKEDLMISFYYV
jgi:hypothetical protein